MVKREERDTTSGDGNSVGVLKTLSNDVIFGFFTDDKLVQIVQNLHYIALSGEKDSDRISASKEILDRVLGKPKQHIENNVTLPSLLDIPDSKIKEILNKIDVRKPNETGTTPADSV